MEEADRPVFTWCSTRDLGGFVASSDIGVFRPGSSEKANVLTEVPKFETVLGLTNPDLPFGSGKLDLRGLLRHPQHVFYADGNLPRAHMGGHCVFHNRHWTVTDHL